MNVDRRVLAIGAALVLPLLVVLAVGFRFDPHSFESPLVGRPAPDFELPQLSGPDIALANLAGRPVVLNFWATWCIPCVQEHPVLLAGARRYADRVTFLGVIYQDDLDACRDYVARAGAFGPSLIDEGSEVAVAYGVYGVPETFFIDSEGVVHYKHTGPIDPRTLDRVLGEIL